MPRLTLLEWCLAGVGIVLVATGLWRVLSPRATTVVYLFDHPDDVATPGTHWYSLNNQGLRLAGAGAIVVGTACLWFAQAGARRTRQD